MQLHTGHEILGMRFKMQIQAQVWHNLHSSFDIIGGLGPRVPVASRFWSQVLNCYTERAHQHAICEQLSGFCHSTDSDYLARIQLKSCLFRQNCVRSV